MRPLQWPTVLMTAYAAITPHLGNNGKVVRCRTARSVRAHNICYRVCLRACICLSSPKKRPQRVLAVGRAKKPDFNCYIGMEKPIDIIKLMRQLPLDFMAQTADELKVDYKAKKLSALRLFALLLIGFLRHSNISQRKICEQSSSIWLDEFLQIDIGATPLSHSSIAERLSCINPEYFAQVYDKILMRAERSIDPAELEDSNIIRIDTTLVSETSAKLSEGINTGVNNRFGGQKKHVKYGMAYDGFSAVLEKVFTEQKASGEEIALGETVIATAENEPVSEKVFVFDRGTTGYDTLCHLKNICAQKNCHFVSRLKLSRIYHIEQSNITVKTHLKDDEFEVIEDNMAFLNRPSKSSYGKERFRIIRVKFIKPRPRTLPSAKRRRYEPEMLLITDDFESDVLDIVHEYKKRWSIEVFYKFLKQNLSFSHLLSTSKNGIQVMLYMTLITAVLIKLYAISNGIGPTLAQSRMVIQLENWIYTHPLPQICQNGHGATKSLEIPPD